MKLSEDIMKQWGIPDQKCGRGLGAVAVNLKSGTEKTFGCNDRIKSFVLYVWVWVNMIRLEIDTLVIIYIIYIHTIYESLFGRSPTAPQITTAKKIAEIQELICESCHLAPQCQW